MAKLRTLLCALLLALGSAVRAADYSALCAGLGQNPPPHPYLIFNDADKGRILDHLRADQVSREIWEKIQLEGLRYLNATVEPPAPPRESHTRYVGSDDYVAYMQRHASAAVTLAFLYQMTGDPRYAEKSFEHADRLCALDSWVQSPHRFDVIYSRVWPYGAKDDEVVFTYDITSAGITRDLSYVYDWLYPALTKAQRDRIRSGLLEKAITRVRGSYDYFWWNSASRCNWSGICHSGLGLAALTLLHEDPGLTDVIAHSCQGVSNLLDHIDPDGGWQEGRGYWAYGVGESALFIEAVKRATGGRIDFFKHPALSSHPVDFALYGLTAAFCDGSGAPVGNSYFINKLVAESGDPHAAWYDRNFVRSREGVFDLIWPAPDVAPLAPTDGSKLFRGINWAVLRKDFTADSMTVACKAGLNDDPHHGHLDCGTFDLMWHNVNFVGEPAKIPYDEQYFGALRWDHIDAKTEAHNVVLVNGEEQICAKLKDQPWKIGIGGPITQYHSDADWAYVEMDPTHAYPGSDLKLWHRWIVLDKRNYVVVFDRVGSAPGAAIDVRFHPGVPFELSRDRVVLSGAAIGAGAFSGRRGGGGGGDRVPSDDATRTSREDEAPNRTTAANVFPPRASQLGAGGRREASDLIMLSLSNGDSALMQGREANVPITEEDNPSWIPYFSTVLKAPSTETFVASIFGPSGANAPKDAHLSQVNGVWQVSFTAGSRLLTFGFTEDSVTRASTDSGESSP